MFDLALSGSTAVLPSTYNMELLKDADPRFYIGKDTIVGYFRRDESWVAPENALIVPLIRQVRVIQLRNTEGNLSLYPAEGTGPSPTIPGRA